AWTSAGVETAASGVQPMKLRATETPIEAPTPADPPAPSDTAAAATVAWISEPLSAASETSPALFSLLASTYALLFVRMTFCETAPAPATATPAEPPNPAASEAAAETTLMLGWDTVTPEAPSLCRR